MDTRIPNPSLLWPQRSCFPSHDEKTGSNGLPAFGHLEPVDSRNGSLEITTLIAINTVHYGLLCFKHQMFLRAGVQYSSPTEALSTCSVSLLRPNSEILLVNMSLWMRKNNLEKS